MKFNKKIKESKNKMMLNGIQSAYYQNRTQNNNRFQNNRTQASFGIKLNVADTEILKKAIRQTGENAENTINSATAILSSFNPVDGAAIINGVSTLCTNAKNYAEHQLHIITTDSNRLFKTKRKHCINFDPNPVNTTTPGAGLASQIIGLF